MKTSTEIKNLYTFLKTHKLNKKGKNAVLILTSTFLLGCSVTTAVNKSHTNEVNASRYVTSSKTSMKPSFSTKKVSKQKKISSNRKYLIKKKTSLSRDLQPKHKLNLKKIHTSQSTFFLKLAPTAIKLGKKYKIYPSVILAQAAIESNYGKSKLSRAPYYNYFGIKGSYKGNSVTMPTTEYTSSGTRYVIDAAFASYPNVYKSLESNAKLLRYGIKGNSGIYRGAWKINAKNFYQATKSLAKNYATSPVYSQTLNKTIQIYDLNQFD